MGKNGRRPQKKWKWKTTSILFWKTRMTTSKKDGRLSKKKWKIEGDIKKMEDDLKKINWKTISKKWKIEEDLKKLIEDDLKHK